MKVYVCQHCWDYEGYEVDAVYLHEEDAEKWREAQVSQHKYNPWNVQVTVMEVHETFGDAKGVPRG